MTTPALHPWCDRSFGHGRQCSLPRLITPLPPSPDDNDPGRLSAVVHRQPPTTYSFIKVHQGPTGKGGGTAPLACQHHLVGVSMSTTPITRSGFLSSTHRLKCMYSSPHRMSRTVPSPCRTVVQPLKGQRSTERTRAGVTVVDDVTVVCQNHDRCHQAPSEEHRKDDGPERPTGSSPRG